MDISRKSDEQGSELAQAPSGEFDTSIEEAKWLFAAVGLLGTFVLASGMTAAALGA